MKPQGCCRWPPRRAASPGRSPWCQCLAGGITRNLSDTLTAIVIPGAAHHLDLHGDDPSDSAGLRQARAQVRWRALAHFAWAGVMRPCLRLHPEFATAFSWAPRVRELTAAHRVLCGRHGAPLSIVGDGNHSRLARQGVDCLHCGRLAPSPAPTDGGQTSRVVRGLDQVGRVS